MNGLKYLRKQCNLTISDVADILGVTRQAVSYWESGSKEMPEKRKKQLAEYLGIDKKYLGEITEEVKQQLIGKAMFRYDENGKETYRFKPPADVSNIFYIPVFFLGDAQESDDEVYTKALQRKKQMLKKIEDIINWTTDAGSLESHAMVINRNCGIYEMVNLILEKMRNTKPTLLKIPFYFEFESVFKAMLLAYELIDESEISYVDKTKYYCDEDGEWIQSLAKEIKKHWDERLAYEISYRSRPSIPSTADETARIYASMTIPEQIAYIEKRNKEFNIN